MAETHWYRYYEEFFEGGTIKVYLQALPVVRLTPKGAWLNTYRVGTGGKAKFVLRDSKKRYASPTLELARESFVARKKRQARIFASRAAGAQAAADHFIDNGSIADNEVQCLAWAASQTQAA